MCGVFGCAYLGSDGVQTESVFRALETLRHRGPDDEGYLFTDADGLRPVTARGDDSAPGLTVPHWRSVASPRTRVALAHRRLSILDLSAAGHQPMASPNERYWITFNGEIYNYVELRDELRQLGHRFVSNCDTEVLLAAFAQWRADMLPRLVGMFAFAILDTQRKELFLARDPFGIKPLYYAVDGDRFAFASEAKALLTLPWVSRELNATALLRYLRFGIADSGDSTLLDGIRQLPGAHFAEVQLRTGTPMSVTAVPYWRPAPVKPRQVSMAEAAAELRDIFERNVALHLRSDVPLGSCFSGGLDSTALVLTAAPRLASGRVHAFSYINDVSALSEERFVDLVSATAPVDVHKIRPRLGELCADATDLLALQDFPTGSASVYAQYQVFRRARAEGMTVMLDGQGSDEIFGGYPTALSAQMTGLLAQGDLAGMRALWNGSVFADSRMKRRVLLAAFGRFLPARLVGTFLGLAGEPLYPPWIEKSWFRDRGVVAQPPKRGRGADALRDELASFIDDLSLPQLLRFEDRNSMAFSIESRVPFCVPALAEFAMSLPPYLLVSKDGNGKAVLREAMRGIVPDEIIDRPKLGFSTPEGTWFGALQQPAAAALELVRSGRAPFLNPAGVAAAFQQGVTGHFDNTAWRLLSVIQWTQTVGARSCQPLVLAS